MESRPEAIIVDLSDDETNVAVPSTSKASSSSGTTVLFTILQIIENLFIIGIDNLTDLEKLIDRIKSLTSDPCVLQLSYALSQLLTVFLAYVTSESPSQKRLLESFYVKRTFDELLEIFEPLLKKEEFAIRTYTLEAVQKVVLEARKVLCSDKRKHEDGEEAGSSSKKVHVSDSEVLDQEFLNIFSKNKSRPAIISQNFQYIRDDTRFRVTTPGEKGSHLVKIEITEVKDLIGVNEKDYWRKVSKKSLFLLDVNSVEDKTKTDDKKTLNSLLTIMAETGNKMATIENSKFDSWPLDLRKKNN